MHEWMNNPMQLHQSLTYTAKKQKSAPKCYTNKELINKEKDKYCADLSYAPAQHTYV